MRSGKWYRNNEAEVMKDLGFNPTKNSGSGWIEKEDGQTEKLICQLKSTDKESIKVNRLDLDKLKYNASVSHKLPVFVIQFIQSNETYLIIKPEYIKEISESFDYKLLSSVANQKGLSEVFYNKTEELYKGKKESVSNAFNAREAFHNNIKEKFNKEKSAK